MKISVNLKARYLLLWISFSAFPLCGVAGAEIPVDSEWNKLETKNAIIEYQTLKDLKEFNKKIRYYPERLGLEYLSSNIGSDKLKYKVKKKVNALYKRVQEILGMNNVMNRVKIILYPNREQLNEAYLKFMNNSRRAYGDLSPPKAWYVYEFNTIYLNVHDMHEGILAHEIAHSIIDNYLYIRPPEPTAEILARYVDSHLFN